MLERKNIDEKYKWDLSAIYASEAAFDAEYKNTAELVKSFKKYEKTMSKSAADLCEALSHYTLIDEKISHLWQYSSLNFSLDTSDNKYQAMNERVRTLAVSAGEASWFVTPYILKLDSALVSSWLSEYEPLRKYERMIEKIMREKPHTLSDECEKLMAKMQDCLGTHASIRSIFANSDMHLGKIKNEAGERIELTDANYITNLMSQNRVVRRGAFKAMYKAYGQFANTYATLFASRIKEKTTLASVRGYESSLAASTFSDELTPAIYDNLIRAVRKNLQPLYRYYELKRKAQGLEKLHMYDLYPSLVSNLEREYSYEESVSEVLETVKALGNEYYEILKDGLLNKRWADVYPTRGKRSGAFSSGCHGTEPYILLNFNGKYDDVSTLAHEAGHSMHTYYSNANNEPHNSSYTLFVAEVASTVNELLLAHRKLKESKNDDEKLYILNTLMELYKSTLYRQTMFAEFEREMHSLTEKGEPLTAELISKRYYRLVRAYFGPEVVCDKDIAYEWMRVPHFYTSFYVYKYATSISAASAIVKRIEEEGASYVEKYLDFLKCGDSKSPLESLLVAGIDMTDPSVVNGAIEDFVSSIHQFESIYEKRKV